MTVDHKTYRVPIHVLRFFPGNAHTPTAARLDPATVKVILESA